MQLEIISLELHFRRSIVESESLSLVLFFYFYLRFDQLFVFVVIFAYSLGYASNPINVFVMLCFCILLFCICFSLQTLLQKYNLLLFLLFVVVVVVVQGWMIWPVGGGGGASRGCQLADQWRCSGRTTLSNHRFVPEGFAELWVSTFISISCLQSRLLYFVWCFFCAFLREIIQFVYLDVY